MERRSLTDCSGRVGAAANASSWRPAPRGGRHRKIAILAGWLAAILILASPQGGLASVSVYVGKNLTKDGSVLLAGFGDEPSSHWLSIVPRRQHPAGATIAVGGIATSRLPGELIQIPQVPETFRYISMDYSSYSGFPAPLTNGGMNEFGVAVRDVALGTRKELVAMTPNPQRGLNYSDVARIALERARTAREAVNVAIELIKRHGDFTYGGNSHVFADPNEGWVLLTFAGGKGLWVARRLGPDDVWLNWRGYTGSGYVQTLPADWKTNPDYLASDNFVSFAQEQGWYKPEPGVPFNVISVYTRQNARASPTDVEARSVEAAVRAAAPKVDVQVLMNQLHRTGRDSSGYGQVAHLRADLHPDLRTLWVAPGPGPTAAFVPWRIGVESVPPEYRRHRYLTAGEADRSSIEAAQQGLESTNYANRAVKRLLYLVNEHPDAFLPEVTASLAAFERKQLEAQPGVERTARILLEAREEALARRYLTEQAHTAAGTGLNLIQSLAVGIEARTKALYGIRTPEDSSR
ncbi:MAG: C69 family dipeptidase [Bryobacteraceae bacterium]